MVDVQGRRSELRGGVRPPHVGAPLAPALLVPYPEKHQEVFQQCEEHEQRARYQPHLYALQLERVRRVGAAEVGGVGPG